MRKNYNGILFILQNYDRVLSVLFILQNYDRVLSVLFILQNYDRVLFVLFILQNYDRVLSVFFILHTLTVPCPSRAGQQDCCCGGRGTESGGQQVPMATQHLRQRHQRSDSA